MISKIELNDIPGRKNNFNNNVIGEVLEFHNSDWSACEVDVKHYKTAHSAFAAYKTAVKKLNVGVGVMARDNRLFLVKK